MKSLKILTGLVLAFIYSISIFGQNNWVVQNDQDGIKISHRKNLKTSFDDIRVELDVPGKLEQLETIILDVNKYSQWIYSTKKTVLIKKENDYTCVYFTEVSLPWPLSNRYYYSNLSLNRDSANQSFHAVTESIEGYKPDLKGLVKISYTRGIWDVTQKSRSSVHISYFLELDPGGSIPPWAFNMCILKGPLETFKNIRKKMMALNKL